MLRNDLYISQDIFELNDNNFDGQPNCENMMVPQLRLTLTCTNI